MDKESSLVEVALDNRADLTRLFLRVEYGKRIGNTFFASEYHPLIPDSPATVIPSFPIVPVSKRGATTWIRPFSSDEDREAKRLRPLYLRSIPNNDLDFDELFGFREDTESMHNDLKSRRKDRRARSVGLARREFNLRGYQTHQNLVAVVAHSLRAGKDMSAFFGNWRPPERAQKLKAA